MKAYSKPGHRSAHTVPDSPQARAFTIHLQIDTVRVSVMRGLLTSTMDVDSFIKGNKANSV